jgi:hypothetical protein
MGVPIQSGRHRSGAGVFGSWYGASRELLVMVAPHAAGTSSVTAQCLRVSVAANRCSIATTRSSSDFPQEKRSRISRPYGEGHNGSPHDLRVFERARSVRTTETSTSLVFRASRLRRKSHSGSARCSRYGTLLARSRRKRSAGTADRAVDLALCVQLGRVFESY